MSVTITPTSNQAAFDHAVRYFANQVGRAGDYIDEAEHPEDRTFACNYESANGPCVIGSMIASRDDRLTLDEIAPTYGLSELISEQHLELPGTVTPTFVCQLQPIHDNSDNWEYGDGHGRFDGWDDLATLANDYDLDTTVLELTRTDKEN